MLVLRSGNHASALKDPNQQDHHSQDQQKVDKSTKRVRGHDSQQPQNDQDYKDCPKHAGPLFVLLSAGSRQSRLECTVRTGLRNNPESHAKQNSSLNLHSYLFTCAHNGMLSARSLCRADREHRSRSDHLQLIEIGQDALPASTVLFCLDRSGKIPIEVQNVVAQLC